MQWGAEAFVKRFLLEVRAGLFEMANDYIKFGRPEFEVVGGRFHARLLLWRSLSVFLEGYLSPVSDAYKKVCLFRVKDLLEHIGPTC